IALLFRDLVLVAAGAADADHFVGVGEGGDEIEGQFFLLAVDAEGLTLLALGAIQKGDAQKVVVVFVAEDDHEWGCYNMRPLSLEWGVWPDSVWRLGGAA